MNKNLRKLILLSLSLLFLLLTTVTFTFSWLSINTSVFVTNIELDISQGDGILLSVDNLSYTSEISNKQIEHAIVAKKLGYQYVNGSLIDSENKKVSLTDEEFDNEFKKIRFGTVTTDKEGRNFFNYDGSSANLKDGKYIEFDLYFKAENDDTSIYFNYSKANYDSNGKLVKNTGIDGVNVYTSADSTNNSYLETNLTTLDSFGKPIIYEKGHEGLLFNGKNAMRFLTNVDDEIKIYEPNIGRGSYATNLDSTTYEDMFLEASYYDYKKNASFTYLDNLKKDEKKPLNYQDTPKTFKNFKTYEASHIGDISKKDDTLKVTFVYWLEGYDADCLDAIVGKSTTISLAFTTKAVILYEKLKTVNYHDGDEVKTINYYDYFDVTNDYFPFSSDGKIFGGWYTNEEFNEKFDFSKVRGSLETSFDCYALWK